MPRSPFLVPARLAWLPIVPSLALAFFTAAFFGVRLLHGIWFEPFGDESSHLVGGWMLDEGGILYRSFVEQHGPFIFMLTQAYGAVFGWAHANWVRAIPACMAIVSVASVSASGALPGALTRLWAATFYAGLLACVWLMQALYMVNYHAVAGFMLVTALALFIIPSLLGARVPAWRAAVAGACGVLVVATAYSFGPAVVLSGAAGLWSAARTGNIGTIKGYMAGCAAAVLVMLAWMLRFGDIVGYLAFHFAENQFVFAPYANVSWHSFLQSLVPSTEPGHVVHTLALTCCAAGFVILPLENKLRGGRQAVAVTVCFVGIATLCARGTLFQDGCFLIASLAIFSLALPVIWVRAWPIARMWSPLVGCGVIAVSIAVVEIGLRQYAVNSPFGQTRERAILATPSNLGESDISIFARIRDLTKPDDRILAVPFSPDVYMAAHRLPMDGYHYYMPWDAVYAQSPWFGKRRDFCGDVAKTPPQLIYFDHVAVWDHWPMEVYAPCFIEYLNKHYKRQTDFPNLYVRSSELPN
jgi:hypothetical protein